MKNMNVIMENWRKFSIQEELNSNLSTREFQRLIDKNQYLKGTKAEGNLISGGNYVLLFSEESAKHVAERHLDGSKPGSLFNKGVNLREVAKKILEMKPSEQSGGRVKWLGVEAGQVGLMGLKKAPPEEIEKMQDYQMPDGRKETVKIAAGERVPTNEVTLITAELGMLSGGRKALSLITMFPGGMNVDGVQIPMDRGQAAAAGLYYVVDENSPLLTSSNKNNINVTTEGRVTKSVLRVLIKEQLKKSVLLKETEYEDRLKQEERQKEELLEYLSIHVEEAKDLDFEDAKEKIYELTDYTLYNYDTQETSYEEFKQHLMSYESLKPFVESFDQKQKKSKDLQDLADRDSIGYNTGKW